MHKFDLRQLDLNFFFNTLFGVLFFFKHTSLAYKKIIKSPTKVRDAFSIKYNIKVFSPKRRFENWYQC